MINLLLVLAVLGQSNDIHGDEHLRDEHSYMVRILHGRSNGSGVVVAVSKGYHYILTAEHVLDSGTLYVLDYTDKKYVGQVIRRSSTNDLALLKAKLPESIKAIPVAKEWPEEGDQGRLMGFASGWFKVRPVKAFGYTKYSNGLTRIRTENGSFSGDSGGAIIFENELVGIISGSQLDKLSRGINTVGACCGTVRTTIWGK